MSEPKEPPAAKLVMGFLCRDSGILKGSLEMLVEHFGPVDFVSEPESFTYTTYYDQEMGQGIDRQIGGFLRLVPQESLVEIKLFTNEIERRFSRNDKRQINIDPGLLSEERFILATGKNYTHRIYLGKGIYADLTLIFQGGAYRGLPWTYPDYRSPRILHYLGVLRQKLQLQRNGRLPRTTVSRGGKL